MRAGSLALKSLAQKGKDLMTSSSSVLQSRR